jgi:hypothetical protein
MFVSPKSACILFWNRSKAKISDYVICSETDIINCHTDEKSKSKLLKLLEIFLHHICFWYENKFFKPNKGIKMKSNIWTSSRSSSSVLRKDKHVYVCSRSAHPLNLHSNGQSCCVNSFHGFNSRSLILSIELKYSEH